MNDRIPERREDELFFYANRLVYDGETDRWEIHVDPDDCLTGYADAVDVSHPIAAIEDSEPTVRNEGSRVVYEGRLLFSAGVILLIDGHVVLLYRDAEAPVDPCKWTSPAGRCDNTPGRTALQELYEELLVVSDGRPVHIAVPDRETLTGPYQRTLRNNGIYASTTDWETVTAGCPPDYEPVVSTVETHYGDETAVDEFWAYFNTDSSVLELRYIIEISTPDSIPMIRFEDGEYDRQTALFTHDELQAIPTEDLVPANAAFRDRLG